METGRNEIELALKAIFQGISDSHLGKGVSRDGVIAMVMEIFGMAENILGQVHGSETQGKPACGPGCSYCCHSRISLTPAEALLIYSWMDTRFSTLDLASLGKRIQNNQFLTRGKSLKDRVLVKDSTPCVFLENGKCSIYPVRPFICRSWTSYSKRDCREAFRSGNHDAEIETSASNNFVYQLARDLVRSVCSSLGLEAEPTDLLQAMGRCLSMDDPFGRWLHGDPVFHSIPVSQGLTSGGASFMAIQIPLFLHRFALSYTRDSSCIEYFLYSREKKEHISRELILSYEACSQSINVSKFYPEIFRETVPKYMSAACFFLMIYHAAGLFNLDRDSSISLETRLPVFESFYSRLKDFDFSIRYRRTSDNCNVRGIWHALPVDTSMVTIAAPLVDAAGF